MEKEKNVKILDTNVLLDFPQIVTKDSEYWIIPMCVLREIDDLKKSQSQETAQKARKAAVLISKNMGNIEFETKDNADKADDQLLKITKERKGTLITNDVALKVRATVAGIDTEGYSWNEDYTGITYVDVEQFQTIEDYNAVYSELMQSGIYEMEDYTFSKNEYLIMPPYQNDDSLGNLSIFKFNGAIFEPVHYRSLKDTYDGDIKPRNPEQACLIDALLSDIPILYASGGFGTGKTYLTHNYAVRELISQRIKKIVYVPNNSYTQNTMDLGALPGDLMEKILPSIGPLVDLVGIDQINAWMAKECLEVVPVAYIRGRSFNDSIILVSEAENLTEEHIKLLVGRCGENCKIFFDGDIHQADSSIFKDRNGLKLLLNLHNTELSNLFSTVRLNRIERSQVACAADILDKM